MRLICRLCTKICALRIPPLQCNNILNTQKSNLHVPAILRFFATLHAKNVIWVKSLKKPDNSGWTPQNHPEILQILSEQFPHPNLCKYGQNRDYRGCPLGPGRVRCPAAGACLQTAPTLPRHRPPPWRQGTTWGDLLGGANSTAGSAFAFFALFFLGKNDRVFKYFCFYIF